MHKEFMIQVSSFVSYFFFHSRLCTRDFDSLITAFSLPRQNGDKEDMLLSVWSLSFFLKWYLIIIISLHPLEFLYTHEKTYEWLNFLREKCSTPKQIIRIWVWVMFHLSGKSESFIMKKHPEDSYDVQQKQSLVSSLNAFLDTMLSN